MGPIKAEDTQAKPSHSNTFGNLGLYRVLVLNVWTLNTAYIVLFS